MRAALTFDMEHPDRGWSDPDGATRILDALRAADLRGTFFMTGQWALDQPTLARRIADDGHLVGSHSFAHRPFTQLGVRAIHDDLRRAEDTIVSITGARPRPWFRLPYLDGQSVGWVHDVLASAGYRHVGQNIDPADWESGRTRDDVAGDVLRLVEGRDPVVILLHCWPKATPEALPLVLESLGRSGAEFLRVDELSADELSALLPPRLPRRALRRAGIRWRARGRLSRGPGSTRRYRGTLSSWSDGRSPGGP